MRCGGCVCFLLCYLIASAVFGGLGTTIMSCFIIKIIGTVNFAVAVDVIMIMGWITVVVMVLAGGVICVTSVFIRATLVGVNCGSKGDYE